MQVYKRYDKFLLLETKPNENSVKLIDPQPDPSTG